MSSLQLVPTSSNAALFQITQSTRAAKRRRQRQRRAARRNPQKTLVIPAVSQSTSSVVATTGRNRRRRGNRRVRGVGSSMDNKVSQMYRATLEDPFENPGVRLGFGCMTPTALGAMYLRSSLTASTDGSFEIAAHPNAGAGGFVFTSAPAAGVSPVWTAVAASNSSAVTSAFSVARVVSFGLRVRVLQAQTAAPGVLVGYASAATEIGNAPSVNGAPNTFTNIPNAHLAYGGETIEVLWRPRGPEDFDFASLASTTGTCFGSGGLYVTGTGFPTNATVFFEAILHFEAQTNFSGAGNPSDITDQGYGGSGLFDTVAAAARIVSTLGPEIRSTIQQVFGLNSGLRGVYSGSRTGQVTIEEMKEF